MNRRVSYAGLLAALAAIGCVFAAGGYARTQVGSEAAPAAVSPTQAVPGQTVTITGTDLQGTRTVTFGTMPARSFTVDQSGTWIKAVVPAGAPTGTVYVNITASDFAPASVGPLVIGSAAAPPQPIPPRGPRPQILSFAPTTGWFGSKLSIHGTHLDRAIWLKVGGASASFSVLSPTKIVAVVPRHARAGARIVLHTTGGTATSIQRLTIATGPGN